MKVTMTIDPLEGDREVIEKALDDYGLVVTGEMKPEEFTDDKLLVIELKSELRNAQNKMEMQKELLQDKNVQIDKFFHIVQEAVQNKQPINLSQETATGDNIKITSGNNSHFAKDNGTLTITDFSNQTIQNLCSEIDEAIEKSESSDADKQDAKEQLEKIGNELQRPEPDKGRIERCLAYIAQTIPDAAKVVSWKELIEKTLN